MLQRLIQPNPLFTTIFIAACMIFVSGDVQSEIVQVEVWPYGVPTPMPVDVAIGDTIEFTSDHPSLIPCQFGGASHWSIRVDSGVFGAEWISPVRPMDDHTILSPEVLQWAPPVGLSVFYYTPPWNPLQFCPSFHGCLRVLDPTGTCCEGTRGNIELTCDDSAIDVADLTRMVTYMFKNGEPPICPLEADIDGDGSNDIADVTALVSYMFKGGPEPAPCP